MRDLAQLWFKKSKNRNLHLRTPPPLGTLAQRSGEFRKALAGVPDSKYSIIGIRIESLVLSCSRMAVT
jgi:hypothetical protein